MDEDFLDVTTNSKHAGILLMLVIVVLAGCGYFFVFKKIHYSVKTVEIEYGEEPSNDVRDYLKTKVTNYYEYRLDLSRVNTEEVGEYTYYVSHNKTRKKGTIKVVDTKAPEFTLQELTIEENDPDLFLGDFLVSCEDQSKPCLVTLKNSKDEDKFGKIGKHEIEIEVADIHGNKSNATATLNVVKKGSYVDPKSLDLEYASNSKDLEPFKGLIYKKLEKALKPEGEQAGAEMSNVSTVDLEKYVEDNYPGSKLKDSEIIELYNKSSYVIGYSIMLTINNGYKDEIVYVDKDRVNSNREEEE